MRIPVWEGDFAAFWSGRLLWSDEILIILFC